jgi:AcrR family transcriptional regulator
MKEAGSERMIGLRERKKARTKALVQEVAMGLFAARGYDNTTVEDIAAAAEISPSTFYRYFRTKEAVVLFDSLDPIIAEAIRRQPKDRTVIGAFRGAMRETLAGLTPEQAAVETGRFKMMLTVPALRASILDEAVRNIGMLQALIAERTGHSADESVVLNLAGAIVGIVIAVFFSRQDQPLDQLFQAIDDAFGNLEAGLAI